MSKITQKAVRICPLTLLVAAGLLVPVSSSWAQVVVDAGAAGARPTLSGGVNGPQIVNIARPTAGGVSVNNFTSYNVAANGLVLNNATAAANSTLAGRLAANDQLGGNAARVILNQVTSGNASQLLGTTEIAGNKANLIVANPNGITCNGCGFVNAPRVTLTTGAVNLDKNGNVANIDVSKGDISVGADGLAASGSQIDLIARAMRINGAVKVGSKLSAIAGANTVDYASGKETAKAATGSAPQVAIDVGALGSMYGSSVRLVGTENGVGVNIGGMVDSLSGDLELSNAGALSIKAGGGLRSTHDTKVTTSGDVSIQGVLGARNAATIQSAGLSNQGFIYGENSIRLVAGGGAGTIDNSNGGLVESLGAVGISAGSLDNSNGGTVFGEKSVQINAARVVNDNDGWLNTDGRLDVTASSLSNVAGVMNGNTIAVRGDRFDNTRGAVNATSRIDVTTGTLVNADTLVDVDTYSSGEDGWGRPTSGLIAGSVSLNVGTLDNHAGKVRANDIRIVADSVHNTNEGSLLAQSALNMKVTNTLNNASGKLSALGNVNLTAGDFVLDGGSVDSQDGIASLKRLR